MANLQGAEFGFLILKWKTEKKKKIPSGEIYFLEMSKNRTVVLVCFRERSTVGT